MVCLYNQVLDPESRVPLLVREREFDVDGRISVLNPCTINYLLKKFFQPPQRAEEFVYLVALRGNLLLGFFEISHGSMDSSLVSKSDVIRKALAVGATGIILAHNHPSGNSTPSMPDREVAREMKGACKIVGLSLLDFLIVGDGEYHSFAEKGELS